MVHTGIVVSEILLVVFISLAIYGLVYYKNKLHSCENNESPFCYSLTCPPATSGGIDPADPCVGYAQRHTSDGKIQCANGSTTLYKINNCGGGQNCP